MRGSGTKRGARDGGERDAALGQDCRSDSQRGAATAWEQLDPAPRQQRRAIDIARSLYDTLTRHRMIRVRQRRIASPSPMPVRGWLAAEQRHCT